MKNTLFFFFMLIYICGYGQKVNVGIRTGASFSNFHNHYSQGVKQTPVREINQSQPDSPEQGSNGPIGHYYETDLIKDLRIGIFSYLFLEYEITRKLSSEIGFGYTQRGIDIHYSFSSSGIDSDNNSIDLFYKFNRELRLDYLTIPLTLQYKLDNRDRFYIIGGIYTAMALDLFIKESMVTIERNHYDPSGNFIRNSGSWHRMSISDINKYDAGIVAGFGLNFPLTSKLTAALDIRSAIGMINVPRRYDEFGFQSFSETARNIGLETGLRLQYNIYDPFRRRYAICPY